MYLYQFCKPTYIGDILKCVRWLYLYDDAGSIIGLQSGGETYYLSKTLEGDVTAVLDESGRKVAQYVYDMWGKLVGVYDGAGKAVTDPEHIALRNPFRYRGYMYDEESGLYYLQSRYYDPVTGRFVNADSILSTDSGISGYNMFAYCFNNPMNLTDHGGKKPGDLFNSMDEAAKDAALYMGSKSFSNQWEYATSIYTKKVTVTRTAWLLIPRYSLKFSFARGFYIGIDFSLEQRTYKTRVTKYTYKKVRTDKQIDSVVPPKAPWFKETVATVHTHPYSPVHKSFEFSIQDINVAYETDVVSYLYSPNGTLLKYIPGDDGIIIVFTDLPTDPHLSS